MQQGLPAAGSAEGKVQSQVLSDKIPRISLMPIITKSPFSHLEKRPGRNPQKNQAADNECVGNR